MTVPSDRNIAAKEFEKLAKYKDLEIEISKMWRLKTTTTSGGWSIGNVEEGIQQVSRPNPWKFEPI